MKNLSQPTDGPRDTERVKVAGVKSMQMVRTLLEQRLSIPETFEKYHSRYF